MCCVIMIWKIQDTLWLIIFYNYFYNCFWKSIYEKPVAMKSFLIQGSIKGKIVPTYNSSKQTNFHFNFDMRTIDNLCSYFSRKQVSQAYTFFLFYISENKSNYISSLYVYPICISIFTHFAWAQSVSDLPVNVSLISFTFACDVLN